MRVIYYVHAYFLDNGLEIIDELKKNAEVHVYIEVSPGSNKSTAINIQKKWLDGKIRDLQMVIDERDFQKICKYVDGVSSCKVVLYKSESMFSFSNNSTTNCLTKEWMKIGASIIHFDTISTKLFSIYKKFNDVKFLATIHDPLPHSGEGDWKLDYSRYIFGKYANGYFFHSKYSERIFRNICKSKDKHFFQLGMRPYSIFKNYQKEVNLNGKYILFFGRLSQYKGIDILLESIPIVSKCFPNEVFLIIGKGNLKIEDDRTAKSIHHMNDYLGIDELAKFISDAKFIVCPYRDATQSGVLMTAFALNKKVIATNVGAFNEFIKPGLNGDLCEPEPNSLANSICRILDESQKSFRSDAHKPIITENTYHRIHEYYKMCLTE